VLLATLLVFGARASGQPSWPEGYGERWQRLVDGWSWRPAGAKPAEPLRGRAADDGVVEMSPGEWWFTEAREAESFRVVAEEGQPPAGASLELYAVTRGSLDVGPRPEELGPPPWRSALLAERLPWVERAGECRAELGPGQEADWIAIRCAALDVPRYRFALDAYARIRSNDSWERLERSIRRALESDWPVPEDPETLPGFDVGRHLRAHRVLLPWTPAQDGPEERRLRIAAWLITDLASRHPVREHARSREWGGEGLPKYEDRAGRPWYRADRFERDVEGPCVLRVQIRLAWPARPTAHEAHLDARICVGDARWRLTAWPGADLDATTHAWEQWDRDGGQRWLLSNEREIRIPVPPGRWRAAVEPGRPCYVLVQELRSIDQAEHRDPFRSLPAFAAPDWRAAAASSVALELRGRAREALALLEAHSPGDAAPRVAAWFLWRRLAVAMRLGDDAAADRAAPALARLLPEFRGDLAAEARLSLLRYAIATRRDGMAGQVAQWIYDDPPAEPEDFVEALSAWCTGRRPLERMRAWPVSAEPRTLRRFLRDVEARSVREVFGVWADLGTVGTTAGGRRWLVPLVPQVAERPISTEALSAWLNLRSQAGAGPWHLSRAEDLRATVLGDGFIQLLPAADWAPPSGVEMSVDPPGESPPRSLGGVRFRDPHALGSVSLLGLPKGSALAARPFAHPERVYLWRGQNVVFGASAGGVPSPPTVESTGDVPERWAILTDLFPLDAPAGSLPSADFRGENYGRAGLVRYRLGVAVERDRAGESLDVTFSVSVGGEELPLRRLLWIGEAVEGLRLPARSFGAPAESYAPGPVVSGMILVAPGPALVRIEASRKHRCFGSVSELDVAATPVPILTSRARSSVHPIPPSGLWAAPRGVTGDPAEGAAAAAATRAVMDAAGPLERAARLEERARLLWTLGRARAVVDFQEAEQLYPEGSLDRDRVSVALAVISFRAGNDLELRARTEAVIRAGGRSRELFLLAAVAGLGTDDLGAAAAWLDLAQREPADGSEDLERFVCASLNLPAPPGEAADPFLGVMTELLRLRRLDPAGELPAAIESLAKRCEEEAVAAASRYLFGRGARFEAWARDARMVLPYAGTSDWPPPRGVLAPLERGVDLRSEEVLSTPPVVRLAGRFGAWRVAWLTPGSELKLSLPGPEVYEFEWRSAHGVEGGVPRDRAAPARLIVEGLPGIAARAMCASEVSLSVSCERMPWAAPGEGDAWRMTAPAGTTSVAVRAQAGAGFLTVRRVVAPVWLAWDARSGPEPAPHPFPPPLELPEFAPDAKADIAADVRRRLEQSRKAAAAIRFGRAEYAESLTALADDLLFAVMTRPAEGEPEWVVRALDLYLKAHADGLGNAHWQAHYDLARVLTRWTNVDISADLPEFRRVRIPQDLPDDPAQAVSNALFFPFPNDSGSVLFDNADLVEWHHRAAEPHPLHVEIVAANEPFSNERVLVEISKDGRIAATGELAVGVARTFEVGSEKEALLAVRVASPLPGLRVRARVRLMVEAPGGGLAPVVPERRGLLYRAPAGRLAFAVRGPTLARLETWEPGDLKPTADPGEWTAAPAPIAATLTAGVPRAGAATAAFELPDERFVRLAVRTVDGPALARAAPPPLPAGDITAEAGAPPSPERAPEAPERRRDEWRLVEYPGMLEVFSQGTMRSEGSEDDETDSGQRDEIRGGLRLHWKGFDEPVYMRFTLYGLKESSFPVVQGAQIRVQHYFLERPDLSWRVLVDAAGEPLGGGYYGYSYEVDARLRWRCELDEQWLFYLSGALNHWWSSLEDASHSEEPPHRYVFNDYRNDHPRWLEFQARLRALPWQNVRVDMYGITRSNKSRLPWDVDRWRYGVEVAAHYEDLFVELQASRIVRVDDDHRAHRGSERRVGATLAYETWLDEGVWMSAECGYSWSPDDHSREAFAALVFRFGGHSGDRLDHVDPELVRFLNYHQSRHPWRP
jgi:hypothetical protein